MFIDTHAHIYIDRFKDDLNEIINRSLEQNVTQILMPNIDVATIDDVIATGKAYPEVCKPMVGLHPCSVNDQWKEDLQKLRPFLDDKKIIAVGEIGIDLYWDKTYAKAQEEAFRYQISWAKELGLPIVIHSRAAIDITIEIVTELQDGNLKGVFHCFDQSYEHGQRIINTGFYMGLGGVITYKKNNEIREAISQLPMSALILETDAPYLPPVPYRGKRNESSYIPIVAEMLSQIKDISIDEVAQITTENAKALFGL